MRGARARDERGATAILVALVASFLTGLVAFTTDFGIAYANNRSLQTVADAAALGAAGVFAEQQARACTDIYTAGSVEAYAEAQEKVAQNAATTGPTVLQWHTPTCEDGKLVVRVTVSTASPNIFGKVLGRSADYNLERSAAAAVEAGTTGPRLRPMALCAADIPALAAPGTPFKLYAPGDAPGWQSTSCPQPDNTGAGNWWTLDCPNENQGDGNGTSALADQIRNGCSTPIELVPGQEGKTGTDLNDHLASACASGVSVSAPFACLGGDPGQPDPGNVPQAWKDVINSGVTVPIPVFCTNPGSCAYSSVTGTGTNAVFPVHKLMGVQVCGYHFGKQNKSKYPTPSNPLPAAIKTACAEADTMLADVPNNSSDVYLVLIARNVQISNVTAESTCDLGDDKCDGGLRQVRMIAGGFTD